MPDQNDTGAPVSPEEAEDQAQSGERPESATAAPTEPRRYPWVLIGVVGVVLAVVTALGIHFVAEPFFQNRSAQSELQRIAQGRGPIAPANQTLVTFTGTKLENVNVEQKALAQGNVSETPAAGILFRNGKEGTRKNVEVFVDFGSQRSRDFLLMNANMLQGAVEGGLIELRIIPVPTGNAFNVYAAEALSESAYTTPEKTWSLLLELTRMGSAIKTDKATDIIKGVADTARELGVKDVDEASIKNGTFASWIVSAAKDSRLKTGFYPPLVYVQNSLVNPDSTNVNDPDEIRQVIERAK